MFVTPTQMDYNPESLRTYTAFSKYVEANCKTFSDQSLLKMVTLFKMPFIEQEIKLRWPSYDRGNRLTLPKSSFYKSASNGISFSNHPAMTGLDRYQCSTGLKIVTQLLDHLAKNFRNVVMKTLIKISSDNPIETLLGEAKNRGLDLQSNMEETDLGLVNDRESYLLPSHVMNEGYEGDGSEEYDTPQNTLYEQVDKNGSILPHMEHGYALEVPDSRNNTGPQELVLLVKDPKYLENSAITLVLIMVLFLSASILVAFLGAVTSDDRLICQRETGHLRTMFSTYPCFCSYVASTFITIVYWKVVTLCVMWALFFAEGKKPRNRLLKLWFIFESVMTKYEPHVTPKVE